MRNVSRPPRWTLGVLPAVLLCRLCRPDVSGSVQRDVHKPPRNTRTRGTPSLTLPEPYRAFPLPFLTGSSSSLSSLSLTSLPLFFGFGFAFGAAFLLTLVGFGFGAGGLAAVWRSASASPRWVAAVQSVWYKAGFWRAASLTSSTSIVVRLACWANASRSFPSVTAGVGCQLPVSRGGGRERRTGLLED